VPYFRSRAAHPVMHWVGQQPDEHVDHLPPSGHVQMLVWSVRATARVAQAEQDRRLAESLSQQASRRQ
jgi:ribosomal protein L32E